MNEWTNERVNERFNVVLLRTRLKLHSRAHAFLTQSPKLHRAIASKLRNSQSLATRHHQVRNVYSLKKLFRGLASISVRRWKLHFPRYRLKFHENPFSRSRERLCGIFWRTEKKQKTDRKKQKKNSCKTYTHPPHRRLRKQTEFSWTQQLRQWWLWRWRQ